MKGDEYPGKMFDTPGSDRQLSHILVMLRLKWAAEDQAEINRHLREVEIARLARVRARRGRG